MSNYDDWKATARKDRAEEYANAMIEDLNTEETILEAKKQGLLEKDEVFEAIQQALYEHFYSEFESRE